ncbi:LamG domain-containing protein, partial [Candidatus Dojkabacteria bacterium]|nr:LamG domain-containing protein [Candidatus Dojkabacteria bacterium]
ASDDWTCRVMPSDTVGEGTSSTDSIEMNTLYALDVDSNINYQTLGEGENSGSTNQSTKITNTGNTSIDMELSGDDMCINSLKSPTAYWKMNDNSANSIVDDSISTNNGTFVGSSGGSDNYTESHSVEGKINSALEFDGNDHIDIPLGSPTLPFSIAFWVNPDSATPVGMFDTAPSQQNVIRNYEEGKVEWWGDDPEVTLGLSASSWQHVAFVFYYDGNRKIDYYKNGSYQGTSTGGTSSTFAWSAFNIGNINNGSAGWFSGDIDDFRIYNFALDSYKVSALYNSGAGTEAVNFYSCSVGSIGVANQEYYLSGFTYGSGTDLSGTPTSVNISIGKPTSSPSTMFEYTYWGIGIPAATESGDYKGANYFTAITDS